MFAFVFNLIFLRQLTVSIYYLLTELRFHQVNMIWKGQLKVKYNVHYNKLIFDYSVNDPDMISLGPLRSKQTSPWNCFNGKYFDWIVYNGHNLINCFSGFSFSNFTFLMWLLPLSFHEIKVLNPNDLSYILSLVFTQGTVPFRR